MSGIKYKDIEYLTKRMRFDLESTRRFIEKKLSENSNNSEERYIEVLENKIRNLEPVLSRVEEQLRDMTIDIKIKQFSQCEDCDNMCCDNKYKNKMVYCKDNR